MYKDIDYYKSLDFFEDIDCNGNKVNGKLKLTKNNANFIETVLTIDSRYKNSSNSNKKPSIEYVKYLRDNNINIYDSSLHEFGSGKFWIEKFIEIIISKDIGYKVQVELKQEKGKNKEQKNKNMYLDLKTVLNGVVCAIDRENSTHLTAHKSKEKVGRGNVSQKIYDYIENNGIDNFIEKLTRKDDFYLIGYITVPKEPNKENFHYSFATKFCKYVSLTFNNKCDKYYIYDNVIISNIDYYIEKYGIRDKYSKKDIEFNKNKIKFDDDDEHKYREIAMQYKKLYDCLDTIKKLANSENPKDVKRDEIDHIIWYFNK